MHYFNQLLGEALKQPAARQFLLERVVHEETVGPMLVNPLRQLIDATEPQELADFMIGGILKKDLPAPEWPSLLWRLLDAEANAGIRLTENFAMYPTAAVSGWYFSHPEARYFQVGKIDADQMRVCVGNCW